LTSTQAERDPAAMTKTMDPIALARAQLASDRTIDRTVKGLFAVKRDRMNVSAFSFLRGSAPLFYALLRSAPELGKGPGGKAWLTGDLHVQNFGAYRTDDASSGDASVVFGPNDFDEACVGPVRLDLLRLAVSWLLALDERGMDAAHRIASCRALIEGWVDGAFGARARLKEPDCVRRLMEKVEARTRHQLLHAYTRGARGRALLRDHRLWPIPHGTMLRVRAAFADYVARAAKAYDTDVEHFEVLDIARRVAGTGSLGAERYAILARGGAHGEWLFDMKEEQAGSASGLPAAGKTGAARVVRGIEIAAPAPPRFLGTTRLAHERGHAISMLVRRLSPQEDKMDPSDVEPSELDALANYLGWLAGRMHKKGAVGGLGRAWPQPERIALLERAIALAGIHEAAHLAYVSLSK
jgi:uncharacterized protein (DUF2252 family)